MNKPNPLAFRGVVSPRLLSTAVVAAILLLLLATRSTTYAGSATWKTSPSTGNWNNANNWTPLTIPNGSSDTATFASSNTTGLSLSANTEVNGIDFNAGASAFAITLNPPPSETANITLTISGVGISNNSGMAQNFVTAVNGDGRFGTIAFTNSATAGSGTFFTNNGATVNSNGGIIQFLNTSTAGNGTFTNNGGTVSNTDGGYTEFFDTSTAGNGTFTTNGSTVSGEGNGFTGFFGSSTAANGIFTNNGGAVSGARGGVTEFFEFSTAGNGTFIINGGGVSGAGGAQLIFGTTNGNSSTAGNATLIANGGLSGSAGGLIAFTGRSSGSTARVQLFGNGNLDMSLRSRGGTIGSIEGSGLVFLGALRLRVGSNNASTTFSGVIRDDGGLNGGTGGSLAKVGTGKLTLTGANLYSGGTLVRSGRLLVNNTSGSGTGTGPVFVNGGALGGNGSVAGAVTVGNGSGSRAFLVPGATATVPSRLTIQSGLAFNSDATYKIQINSAAVTADKVVANGVTINAAAQFTFEDLGAGTLPPGTVFTVINNASASPIAGTFVNLPDGSTFTVNGNTFRADYQGGDGNDLTLKLQ